jgi:hypothetical protein
MEDTLGTIEKGRKPGLVLIENSINRNGIFDARLLRII